MSPPKGWKKKYEVNTVTFPALPVDEEADKMVDELVARKTRKKKTTPLPIATPDILANALQDPIHKEISRSRPVRRKKKDPTPVLKNVPDDKEYAKIIVVWRDQRGMPRSTQYVMADLSVNENVSEEFKGPKKDIRIHLSIEGQVLEKQ